jgi:hypothetical protein
VAKPSIANSVIETSAVIEESKSALKKKRTQASQQHKLKTKFKDNGLSETDLKKARDR